MFTGKEPSKNIEARLNELEEEVRTWNVGRRQALHVIEEIRRVVHGHHRQV